MSAASPPSPLRVFPDTGALLAMLLFPRDREGNLTLAGELLEKMPYLCRRSDRATGYRPLE